MQREDIDGAALRGALGRFATGVAIVTARSASGDWIGLTVNSFTSVSLEPPFVLWGLRRAAYSYPAFRSVSHWTVNVLAADQLELARRFCSPVADRFALVPAQPGMAGAPLLEGAIARFQCAAEREIDGGDHVLFLGRVMQFDAAEGEPLIFLGGRFGKVAMPCS